MALDFKAILRPDQHEIGYKTIWLAVVAYALWATNRLAGSPAEGSAGLGLP
jgi:hypothetical protein